MGIINGQIVYGAIGGALIAYGLMQRAKAKTINESLAKSIAQGEGWIGIGVGALLVVTSFN